jgi:hypothetical protein
VSLRSGELDSALADLELCRAADPEDELASALWCVAAARSGRLASVASELARLRGLEPGVGPASRQLRSWIDEAAAILQR